MEEALTPKPSDGWALGDTVLEDLSRLRWVPARVLGEEEINRHV